MFDLACSMKGPTHSLVALLRHLADPHGATSEVLFKGECVGYVPDLSFVNAAWLFRRQWARNRLTGFRPCKEAGGGPHVIAITEAQMIKDSVIGMLYRVQRHLASEDPPVRKLLCFMDMR